MARNVEGFRDFAAARGGSLFRTAWWLTGDWHLAEDLVQETLGKVYRRWRGPDGIDNPAGYARTVLVRTYVSHRRRRSSSEVPTGELPDRSVHDDDAALRLALLEALARLSAKDRAVLVLRYWEDRSLEETATELGMSTGAVKSRSFHALKRLRVVLGDGVEDLSVLD
ncbi:SigE family RNA polymerase sigma factor [Phytoactinopolyspora halotolerans]|uniref:SigE family RNA polymerase sigma factor n=1 Tax=Phytoactinopolyspora halotolerans TaxID=1981512 RepID=UPI001C20168B|nr:SigE family RNA polymerase sigma factor [Phytoactinopolyspora halotolerans]